MNLFQEYSQQQNWRCWERYLKFLPFDPDDTVVDLGCLIGNVSHMFSSRVEKVVGIDINQEFISFCDEYRNSNETFICSDFTDIDYFSLGTIKGIWSSFSLLCKESGLFFK